MIKINKNYSSIPDSLKLPFNEFFTGKVPLPPQTTHLRRIEIINNGKYIDEVKYNDRYKQDDTKASLRNIYHGKCAYCEQRIEQSHVEHYRPKKKYYWLAFSWDNLILACPVCNQFKGTNFEIQGSSIAFENSDINIQKIHAISSQYDGVELPKMVNPEITDPIDKIEFQKDGFIKSTDICFAYTIEKCKIDRKDLNDERRKLLDVFKKDILSAFVDNQNINERKIEIQTHVRKFIRDSQDVNSQFIAFRKFAISSGWLNDIVREMN